MTMERGHVTVQRQSLSESSVSAKSLRKGASPEGTQTPTGMEHMRIVEIQAAEQSV